MQVLRAEHLGFCFGVRDALRMMEAIDHPAGVTIHGELVHNPLVLHQLDLRGFIRQSESDRTGLPGTERVVITAHGISDRERQRLESAGKQLIDTTCPLVMRVHKAAQELAAEGRHVIVIGRPGHVEVQGIVEDLPECTVVADVEGVRSLPRTRLGVVCQSTTPPRLAAQILQAIQEQNPGADLRAIDTICHPTRDRQQAVLDLVDKVQAMVVIGGKNSNNTRELVRLCEEADVPTHHVESADELRPEWFAGVTRCGVTAGTSTLDVTIDAVCSTLEQLETVPADSWRRVPATPHSQ